MKKLLILPLVLFAVGCGSSGSNAPPDVGPPTGPIPPDDLPRIEQMQTSIDEFNSTYSYFAANPSQLSGLPGSGIAVKYSGSIPQRFDDLAYLGTNVIGVCWYRGNGTRDIQYDRGWWDKLSPIQRRVLVAHEMGHCTLSRAHRCSDVFTGYSIKSFMYPSIEATATLDFYSTNKIGSNYIFDLLGIELFDKYFQGANDCPTATVKSSKLEDVPHIDTYQEIFGK